MSEPSGPMAELTPQQKRALLTQLLQSKVGQMPEHFPLSYGQRALWLTYQLAPDSWAYHVLFSTRMRSAVDASALQRAFQKLLDRHAALRTTYLVHDGHLEQHVHRHAQVDFSVTDVATWPAGTLEQRLHAEARRPFDLASGPLMRVRLFSRAATEHILLLVIHHIGIDFWSLGVLLDELSRLYPAESTGCPLSLPSVEVTYDDFVQWQARMLAGKQGERLWTYWQGQLADAAPLLSLPTDHPRPPVQTYDGATQAFQISPDLTQQLKALAHAEGVTLHTLLLAAFEVLLYRYTGQEDILVGSFMAGRMRPEFRRLVGYLVNPVVLRARLAGNPAFTVFLRQVHETLIEALKHQDYPFSLLVERLNPVRHAGHSPLFQVAFLFQQLHQQSALLPCFVPGLSGEPVDFAGLVLEPWALPQQEGQFDLTLEMAEVGVSLHGGLKYNTALFEAETMARMAGHLQTVLQGIVLHPEQRLSMLPLMSESERQQLLVAWNDTRAGYPNQCLHALFEAQVRRSPDAVAVVCGDAQLTYGELNRRANQLAHHLQSLGVGPEVLVGLCMERSLEMVIGLLGILKAGGAYVPLDPAYPAERLAFMLHDTQVPVLLTQQCLASVWQERPTRVVCLDTDWQRIATHSEYDPVSGTTPENAAYVIYTSGSTGVPKGVIGLHRGAVNRCAWMWQTYPFSADEVGCQKTSLNFVDSVWELFGPLLQGIRIVLIPDAVVKDVPQLVQALAAHQVTRLVLVPSLLDAMVTSCATLQERLPALKIWISSGEPLSGALYQRFRSSMPHGILLNLYGSSEVAADVTWYDTRLLTGEPASVPLGRPLANAQIYLLDTHQHPVPLGIPGELYVGGDGLARGYLNRPELTAERFMANPWSPDPGARLYRTGDVARYRPDGHVEFLGRADHQVKVRGFRIELGEIEAVLGQHPAVADVVVMARQEVLGDTRLVAYLVPTREAAPTLSALRGFLRAKLPEYMIPAAFVVLDAWPLTPNGKVNRLALPAPDQASAMVGRAGRAPHTRVEEVLAALWAQILSSKQVGMHDNFFDLGGHSLLAVQLMSGIHQRFGRELPLAALFQAPTIADLARLLQDNTDAAFGSLVPIQATGTRPPLFCMHPAGGNVMVYQPLAALLGPDQPVYGLQSRALLDHTQEHGSLDDMAAAYTTMIRQHQPTGPYYLLGWSMGGLLVMAVAHRLERSGQHVAFVGLCDAHVLTDSDVPWEKDPLLSSILAFGGSIASALAALAPHEQQALRHTLEPLSPRERVQRLMAWGRERHLLTASLPVEVLQRQVALAEDHVALCSTHTVAPIRASLYVWWARESLHGRHHADWSRYTVGSVHTEIVEGNHFSMIQAPYVQDLAERVKVCLRRSR